MHLPRLHVSTALFIGMCLLSSCGDSGDSQKSDKRKIVLQKGAAEWLAYQIGWDQSWESITDDIELELSNNDELGIAVKCKQLSIHLFYAKDIPENIDTSAGNVSFCTDDSGPKASIVLTDIENEVKQLSSNIWTDISLADTYTINHIPRLVDQGAYQFIDLFQYADDSYSLRWTADKVDIAERARINYGALTKNEAALDGVLSLNVQNKQNYRLAKTFITKFDEPHHPLAEGRKHGIFDFNSPAPFFERQDFAQIHQFENSTTHIHTTNIPTDSLEGIDILYYMNIEASTQLDTDEENPEFASVVSGIEGVTNADQHTIDLRLPELQQGSLSAPRINEEDNSIFLDYQALGISDKPSGYRIFAEGTRNPETHFVIYLSQGWLDKQRDATFDFDTLADTEGFDPLWATITQNHAWQIQAYLPNRNARYAPSSGLYFPFILWRTFSF